MKFLAAFGAGPFGGVFIFDDPQGLGQIQSLTPKKSSQIYIFFFAKKRSIQL